MICTPGETVEYFYRQSTLQGSNDWKIGDEITKNRNRPMRSAYQLQLERNQPNKQHASVAQSFSVNR